MEPSPTADFRAIVSDPEILARAMQGAELRSCQLSLGSIPSEMSRLTFSSFCLDLARFGPAMLFTGTTPADCYTLVFVLECPEEGRSFNFSIGHHENFLAFFPPGGELDARTPKGYRNAMLTVPAEPFLAMASRLCPEISDAFLSRSAAMRVEEPASAKLRSLLKLAWNLPLSHCAPLESRIVRNLLEDQLLEAFLDALREGCKQPEPPPASVRYRRERKFRKIRDYLADRTHQPARLAEICAEAGLSARAVQDLFQDYLGIGPQAYLRHLRLHATRRVLAGYENEWAESGIVKKAALDHGFWHLGRFSRYYRDLFGESPRITLAKAAWGET